MLDPTLPVSADGLIKSLAAESIEARRLWKPMHLQPVFDGTRSFLNGASEHLFDNGVALPSGSALDDEDIDRVLGAVRAAVGGR